MIRLVLALIVLAALPATVRAQVTAEDNKICSAPGRLVRLPGVAEASGVAVSRRTPGILWVHNDSGQPTLFAVDGAGAVKGRVQLTGASVVDWEDIAAGPCPGGSCLYVADTGDNGERRENVTIYRVREPLPTDMRTEPAEALRLVYPDGAHDAEAMFVTPSGDLFLITKEHAESTALFRLPSARTGGTLERVGPLGLALPTGASASTDGQWVAIRTLHELLFYRTADLIRGGRPAPRRVNLRAAGEPQGEGVALGADGVVYLAGEGGGAGTMATLRCSLR